MDIATLVSALAPAFAAGFALQRLLEILDPILDKIRNGEHKRIVLGLLSFGSGLGLAAWPQMRVLIRLVVPSQDVLPAFVDYLVTALILSGGTEGFNSVIKFLSYKKEEKKAAAVAEKIGVNKFLARRGITMERALAETMARENIDFTPGEAMLIAYRSVTTTTGSAEPITPTATLAKYGAREPDIPTIRDKVINNPEYGLLFYERSLNPNALKDLSTSWTLQELADITFDESF